MKLLIESTPDTRTSLLLGEECTAENEAALQAVNRVLEDDVLREPFNQEEIIAFEGLVMAFKAGTCALDTIGSPQLIPPMESELLLGALKLFVEMPAEERAGLTPAAEENLHIVEQGLENIERVVLLPGVGPEASELSLIEVPTPKPVNANGEYEWLHDSAATKQTDKRALSTKPWVQPERKSHKATMIAKSVQLEPIPGFEWFGTDGTRLVDIPNALDTPAEQFVHSQVGREVLAAEENVLIMQ
ncbi:hypothetical protein H7097_04250 [Aeromicrobium sp.]|nr:hypothetical protein [Candidatus Saccharibacteria bacterium]